MTQHLTVVTLIEKSKIASNVAFVAVLEIEIVDPDSLEVVEILRVVRNDEDIEFQGQTYFKGHFDFQQSTAAGEQGSLSITINDYSKAVQSRMQAYGGGVGFKVLLGIVNTGNLGAGYEIAENFLVISASAADYMVTFRLGTENLLLSRFPRRRQTRDRCPWRYKGEECGYNGALPSCDYTLQGDNGCAAHDNTINFGAFPMLRGSR